MKFKHVPENNVTLTPPVNWDEEKYGPCETITTHHDGEGFILTLEFEREEFVALLRGGNLKLKIFGRTFPPVAVWVAPK
jgi:hypothetical protein